MNIYNMDVRISLNLMGASVLGALLAMKVGQFKLSTGKTKETVSKDAWRWKIQEHKCSLNLRVPDVMKRLLCPFSDLFLSANRSSQHCTKLHTSWLPNWANHTRLGKTRKTSCVEDENSNNGSVNTRI